MILKRFFYPFTTPCVLLLFISSPDHAADILSAYDHPEHEDKVFSVHKIECSHCHNFSLDRTNNQLMPNENLKKSAFKISFKQICHECHRSSETKYAAAPKACYTCHRSMQNLTVIKPSSHNNVAWSSAHSTEARVNSDQCMNCHMTSQCTKCHLERNDIVRKNHSSNFKFFHSVQARAQPHRCDTCHTKSFCINCHLGRK